MGIQAGTQLGSYEITSLLGKGGMGEVYRARDLKLKREVAIKILPDEFSRDPERVNRFQREAEVLASLNHPNIAAIYDFEEANGIRFLVLELVEGETLADRLPRGPIPVEEALDIAKHICEALEAAHEKGVIHRDLKPANVKITPEGKVKVLDFGLAKAMEGGPATTTLSNSPTLTMAGTNAGVIIGTAAYMSPEQARGRTADKRSDVFGFGCVLYEMLTGVQAFHGDEVSDVLASVLKTEPSLSLLSPNLNSDVHKLLRRCLEKNPKHRWHCVGDVRIEIEALASEPRSVSVQTQPIRTRNFWKVAALAFFLGMTAFALAAAYLYRSEPERSVVRFSLSPPDKTTLGTDGFVVSPDGRNLAFATFDPTGKVQLWVQTIDSVTAKIIPNTEGLGSNNWFWSADSRSIGFWMQGKLKKADINGGLVQTICDASQLRGGTWNSEGMIVFAPENNGPLYRVASTGGQPVAVTKLENQSSHRFPRFLPDGQHFLYLAITTGESSNVYLGDLRSGATKHLFAADTGAVYVPPGFVLFIRQGILFAQEFDAKKFETFGDPQPIAEPVSYLAGGLNIGQAAFSASNNGILSYRIGASQANENVRLTWVDRAGKELEQAGRPGPYRGVELSPDGKKLAVHRHDGTGGDLWVFESQRPTPLRLTFDPSQENSSPIWSPDGKQIAFGSLRSGMWGLYQKPSDGAGDEEMLFQNKLQILPVAWSPDGQFLVFCQRDSTVNLWVLPVKGEKKPQPFLRSTSSHGQISPDGRWISYISNESGQAEIYVRPFPSGPGRWQVSANGGSFPRWRPDGKELFYLTSVSNGRMMAVEVRGTASTFEYGAAKELFDSKYFNYIHSVAGGGFYHTYAVSRDGQRFLIPRPVESASDASTTSATVVLNWTAALTKK